MNPVDAWKLVVLERYAKFDGRARREEFWWFTLATVIIAFVLGVLSAVSHVFWILYLIYAVAVFIPSLAVGVRRLHDTNRSGWWLLIDFIPFIGAIVLLIFFCSDSTPGPNNYGASEKYSTA